MRNYLSRKNESIVLLNATRINLKITERNSMEKRATADESRTE